jgi:hypothetical protein
MANRNVLIVRISWISEEDGFPPGTKKAIRTKTTKATLLPLIASI